MATRLMRFWICAALLLSVLVGSPVAGQGLDEYESAPVADTNTVTASEPVYTGAASESAATVAVATGVTEVDDVRRRIVSFAEAEVGKVCSDAGPDGFKIGWQNLVGFYEKAFGYTNLEKDQPYWYKCLRAPNQTIKGGPWSWCGIFALSNWVKAGLPVRWNTRVVGCKYRGDVKKYLQPGDIAIIKLAVNPNNHHCIVKEVNGNELVTIDGMQEKQQVRQRTRKVSDIEIYYSVADAMNASMTLPNPPAPGGGSTPATPTTPSTPGSASTVSGGQTPGITGSTPAVIDTKKGQELEQILQQLTEWVLREAQRVFSWARQQETPAAGGAAAGVGSSGNESETPSVETPQKSFWDYVVEGVRSILPFSLF
ncbi:MAG TPA: hypothetical protein PKO06_03090 [Candidatus Ozemobacteraceae bacterium]|nr:hypothetical protein [Candidatus Ozemobacteraceae bacterium]